MTTRESLSYFGAEDVRRLEELLSTFVAEAQAGCAILVDRSGRLLTAAGETAGMDRVTFASLVAGDFAASDQLASLLGESEFSSLYHQGDGRSMYLADISGWAILAALFDGRTTLGMVRLRSKAVVPKFASVFAEMAARGPARPSAAFEQGWAAEAES
jgi:predicted regulator of Ras-like GTPase activity (Roadblock/LC7/MglB family)